MYGFGPAQNYYERFSNLRSPKTMCFPTEKDPRTQMRTWGSPWQASHPHCIPPTDPQRPPRHSSPRSAGRCCPVHPWHRCRSHRGPWRCSSTRCRPRRQHQKWWSSTATPAKPLVQAGPSLVEFLELEAKYLRKLLIRVVWDGDCTPFLAHLHPHASWA